MISNNILLDPLPSEYKGYRLNTDFRIGIQIMQIEYDNELNDYEKGMLINDLLFANDVPPNEELEGALNYFLNGWYHDKGSSSGEYTRYVDFDVDQYRIYADFLRLYRINLSEVDMHWWEFCGLLWNMPNEQSMFLQVIGVRSKKIDGKMPKEQRKAYKEAQKQFAIEQPKKAYTEEQETKLDEFEKIRPRKDRK